jgi:PAS domain S-box-containing protein
MRSFARSIVETVRHPMLVLDADLRVLTANPAFYRTFQAEVEETVGRPIHELGAGQWNIPQLRVLLEGVLPGGSFEGFEVQLDLPRLGRKVMLLDARLVRHDEGTPVVLLAIEDVTERDLARGKMHQINRELEARVRDRTAELEAANRELEAFCYSVSHDLRAPLRALDGFSDELMRTYPGKVLDERGLHYLERIRAGTQRMGRLIDDLLQLSRLSRGEMRRERTDLTALVQGIATDLRQQEPSRSVAIRVQPGLTAWGDAGLLRIALENLLGNAWKFTSKNPAATIEVGQAESQGIPTFFVRDDGAGFDMAHASKLFRAFQRLHQERDFPGNGVGLATVQRVIRRHGGQVWGEGVPDGGATFFFTLPGEDRS